VIGTVTSAKPPLEVEPWSLSLAHVGDAGRTFLTSANIGNGWQVHLVAPPTDLVIVLQHFLI
jgi:hypothetical protein